MDKSNYLKPREYEMLAILVPDQGEEETQAAIDAVQGYITGENGTIDALHTDSPWGRRRLAYTIRHQGVDYRDGHYVLAYFTALPTAISNIERELKLDTNVIRYLLLINDPEMGEKFDESAIEAEEAAEATSTEEAPAAAAEETPEATEEAAPTEEAQAEETPSEEAATEEAPADEAPAEEAAAEEAPADEAEAEKSEESDEA